MAMLPQAANTPENKEGLGDRTPVPAGTYTMVIKTGEMKETKAKTGWYLSLMFIVSRGECKGRVVWAILNLKNPNTVAVEIATKELNSICQALGLQGVEDSDELLGQELDVTVKIEQRNPEYPPSNTITGYAPASDGGSMAQPDEAPGQTSPDTVTDPGPEAGDPGPVPGEAKPKLPWE